MRILLLNITFLLIFGCNAKKNDDFFIIDDKFYQIPVNIINDTTNINIFSKSNYYQLSRSYIGEMKVRISKIDKYNVFKGNDFEIEFFNLPAKLPWDNYKLATSKYLICVKGFKSKNNIIEYKAFIVFWKDTYKKYYKNNDRNKAYYIVGQDMREFPWEINNLTDSVLTNLDSEIIIRKFKTYNGPINSINIKRIVIDFNKKIDFFGLLLDSVVKIEY